MTFTSRYDECLDRNVPSTPSSVYPGLHQHHACQVLSSAVGAVGYLDVCLGWHFCKSWERAGGSWLITRDLDVVYHEVQSSTTSIDISSSERITATTRFRESSH